MTFKDSFQYKVFYGSMISPKSLPFSPIYHCFQKKCLSAVCVKMTFEMTMIIQQMNVF